MPKLLSGDNLIFRVAIPVPVYRLFDYLAPENSGSDHVKPGVRLEVPFGKGKKIGYLLEIVGDSAVDACKLKPVIRILDRQPLLSAKDLRLLLWAGRYYHHPVGEVVSAVFPAALRQGKSVVVQTEKRYALTDLGRTMSGEQLQRTPKQKIVLKKFQNGPASLSEAELSAWNDNWRPAVKLLIARQLLQIELSAAEGQSPEALSSVAETKRHLIPLIPAFSLKGEGVDTCVDTYAQGEEGGNTRPTVISNNPLQCNPPQQSAINAVCAGLGQFGVFLLEGVTGSGKTEVYCRLFKRCWNGGSRFWCWCRKSR